MQFQDTITVHNNGTGTASVEADRLHALSSVETSKGCRFSLYSADAREPSREKRTVDYEPVSNVLTLQNGVAVKLADIRDGKIYFGNSNSLVIPAETVPRNCVLGTIGTDGVIQPVPLGSFDLAREQGWCRSFNIAWDVPARGKVFQQEIRGEIRSVAVWKVEDISSGTRRDVTGDFTVSFNPRISTVEKEQVQNLVVKPVEGVDITLGLFEVTVVYLPNSPK